MNGYWTYYRQLLGREILLSARQPVMWVLPTTFFILVILIFSVAINAPNSTLTQVAPGVLWASVLLAALLAYDNLFHQDYENGYLEQTLLSPHPFTLLVFAKITAHWLQTAVPFLLILPIAQAMLFFPPDSLVLLLLTLPITTAIISLLTAFGASLTLGKSDHLLTLILILPLSVPCLIFSTAIITRAGNEALAPAILLLLSIGVFLLTILPIATATVLRLNFYR